MSKLTDSERKAIVEEIRSLAIKHLQAGVSDSTMVICHNCGRAKPLAGVVHYDRYRVCNDCALNYALAKAEGTVQTIEDFILSE